tara:strand:- start:867 stop:1781 length:915 start_codon:yes stop_codon:yes gene_type:complete
MKKILITFYFIILLSSEVIAKIENKIVLKVENEIITNFEIKNKILTSLLFSGEVVNQQNIDKYKKEVLNLLIDQKLKKIEVTKYKIEKNNSKIDAFLSSIDPDKNNLEKKFLDNGLNFQIYLDEVTTELKWNELIYKIYSGKIEIDENIIEKEISGYIKNNSKIEEYKISKIEFYFSNKESREKILKIEEEIKEFGFDKIALKYGDKNLDNLNNNLGWINAKALNPEIYKELKDIKIGDVTKPITTQNNIIFLKLVDKKISKKENIDINSFKKKFINQKKEEQFELYSRSHLSKLRNNSLIEYK